MRRYIDIVESYEGAFNTRGKTCEVFRNPTSREFRQLGGEIRAFLVGDDVLMWNAYGALHQEVRDHFKLDRDSISIEVWSEGFGGEDCFVNVTDNTQQTAWFHNPEIHDEIVDHPYLSRVFGGISVGYFDEAIYGPWDKLNEDGDDEDEDEDEDELVEDQEFNDMVKGHRAYNRQYDREEKRIRDEQWQREEKETFDESEHTPPEYENDDADHYDALKKTGFFGAQAAGCIAVARTTGRILVVLRSAAVEQPFTWGNVGGAHHASETPVAAAERELYEETGYHGHVEMIPLMVFQKDSFRYCNFLALVDDEFVPSLGWEADDYKWVKFGQWPQPLHFGLQALFSDTASVAVIKSYTNIGEK